MRIILRQEVDRLGFPGDLVSVRDGYARNFLIPRGLAEPVTKGALQDLERRKELEAKREAAKRAEFEALANALRDKSVTIAMRAGSSNKLYGSVTVRDLQDAIQQQLGVEIERKRLVLEESIKTLGEHERTIRLAAGVEATLTVIVKREGVEEEEEPVAVAVEGYDMEDGTIASELEAEAAAEAEAAPAAESEDEGEAVG
jgi:large subunit ribosomal protein L9